MFFSLNVNRLLGVRILTPVLCVLVRDREAGNVREVGGGTQMVGIAGDGVGRGRTRKIISEK